MTEKNEVNIMIVPGMRIFHSSAPISSNTLLSNYLCFSYWFESTRSQHEKWSRQTNVLSASIAPLRTIKKIRTRIGWVEEGLSRVRFSPPYCFSIPEGSLSWRTFKSFSSKNWGDTDSSWSTTTDLSSKFVTTFVTPIRRRRFISS